MGRRRLEKAIQPQFIFQQSIVIQENTIAQDPPPHEEESHQDQTQGLASGKTRRLDFFGGRIRERPQYRKVQFSRMSISRPGLKAPLLSLVRWSVTLR